MEDKKIEVDFYGIHENGNKVKSLILLLNKTLESSKKAIVLVDNEEKLLQLDSDLWTKVAWLPHALDTDPNPESQLVLLTTDLSKCYNSAEYLFIVDSQGIDISSIVNTPCIQRVFIVFEKEKDLPFAESLWKESKGKEQFNLKYFQQNQDRKSVV